MNDGGGIEVTDDSAINYPPHYIKTSIEPISVIEAWGLGFNLGNVVKYIARHLHKGTSLEDLKKAEWYLKRQISLLERAESGGVPSSS